MYKEILQLFKNSRKKLSRGLKIQICGFYLLIALMLPTIMGTMQVKENIVKSTQHMHRIVDDYFDEDERSFFSEADSVDRLQKLYHWLNESFDYMITNRQTVEFSNKTLPDSLKIGIPHEGTILNIHDSLQVNTHFFEHYTIELSHGRFFLEEEYHISNEPLPILLGNSYLEHFELGEIVTIGYLTKEWTAQIVGFITAESFYNNERDLEFLNKYVILPSLEFDGKDSALELDKKFGLILYLDKTSGIIVSERTGLEIQNLLTIKSLELDLRPYIVIGVSGFYLSMWGIESEYLFNILMLTAAMLTMCSILCVSLNTAGKCTALKKEIAIFIANGYSRKKVILALIMEVASYNLWGLMLGVLLSYFSTQKLILIPFLILFCCCLVAELIYPLFALKKIRVAYALRGDHL